MAWSSLIVEVGEGSYQPNCQTNLVIVISGRAGSNLTCVIMFGIKETSTIFYLFLLKYSMVMSFTGRFL